MSEREHELLTIDPARGPVTPSGEVGCVMLVSTGINDGVYWFRYKTTFFSDPTTVEWVGDAMQAVIPAQVAQYLFKNGYARPMTSDEVQSYNLEVQKETTS